MDHYDNTKALLLSSSYNSGKGYLEHAREAILQFLGEPKKGSYVLFVPYARAESGWHDYEESASTFFNEVGFQLRSVNTFDQSYDNMDRMFNGSDLAGVFVGGGNTFRLLDQLRQNDLWQHLENAIIDYGIKYIGASAGTVVACPSIKTTNDMPIVCPTTRAVDGFFSLDLIPWQINPHFVSGPLIPGHMGETREQRIAEFHEENETPVIGLPEKSWLVVGDNKVTLQGGEDAVWFERDQDAVVWKVGESRKF